MSAFRGGGFGAGPLPSQADERFVASASGAPLGRNEFDVGELHVAVAVAVAGAVVGGAVAAGCQCTCASSTGYGGGDRSDGVRCAAIRQDKLPSPGVDSRQYINQKRYGTSE